MNSSFIKLTISILFIVLGISLLFLKEEPHQITNQTIGDQSLVVVDLSKKETAPRYLYIIGGCILIAFGAAYLIRPHLGQKIAQKNTPSLDNLSERESTIVALIEQGMTNKEIQNELSISLSTVKTHINNIFKKMKVKSRADLLNIIKSEGSSTKIHP